MAKFTSKEIKKIRAWCRKGIGPAQMREDLEFKDSRAEGTDIIRALKKMSDYEELKQDYETTRSRNNLKGWIYPNPDQALF